MPRSGIRPLCSIANCGKLRRALSFCNMHYLRWKRLGDPLAGCRSITPRGEGVRFFREVVLPYEGDECLRFPYKITRDGRGRVWINARYHYTSRLVCEIFHGQPPTCKHEAAHSCGKGHESCVNKRHLSWKTHAANMDDRYIHGTVHCGERHNWAKLTEIDVLAIRASKGTASQSAIAKYFGISQPSVGLIFRGRNWGWLKD